jgi:hypothetical protein
MELEPSSPSGDGNDETSIDEVLGSGGADSRSPGDVLVSALWRAVLDIQSYAQRQHHGTLCQVKTRARAPAACDYLHVSQQSASHDLPLTSGCIVACLSYKRLVPCVWRPLPSKVDVSEPEGRQISAECAAGVAAGAQDGLQRCAAHQGGQCI